MKSLIILALLAFAVFATSDVKGLQASIYVRDCYTTCMKTYKGDGCISKDLACQVRCKNNLRASLEEMMAAAQESLADKKKTQIRKAKHVKSTDKKLGKKALKVIINSFCMITGNC